MADQSDIGLVISDRFEVTRTLGEGSTGIVYEGRDLRDRSRVAIKVLHPHMLDSGEAVARFFREIEAARKIDHPGVVAFRGAGEASDGRPYFVQEFLHGQDMEEALQSNLLQLPQIFDVALQLLDALGAVHAAGIVHRDVKPENLLLVFDEFGGIRVKLVDFGIAKPRLPAQADELTGTGETVGTPYYMSPEQCRGVELDGRADLWSVGVVLFEALAGELPFDDKVVILVMSRIVHKDAPSIATKRPDLPAGLIEVIDRALKRDPKERWPSAAEMAEALRRSVGLK